MSAEVQAVEAEVIEDGAAELALIDEGALSVNFDGLMARIAAINDAVAAARRAEAELAVEDGALEAMGLEEARRFERSLSNAIGEADEARKAFNGDYDTPKKAVGVAYTEAMEPVVALHARYKGRRLAAEEAVKQGHLAALEAAYSDFMEGNGLAELAQAVPLERFREDKWWNSSAKSFSEKKAVDQMIKRATEIVADWNSVKATPYCFPEQAQATFFRTLSLREVNEQDARMREEAERVRAVNAEVEGNRSYSEPEPVYEEVPEEAYGEPDIVAQAEQVVADAAPATYVICADLTASQYAALIDFLKSIGAHGIPMRTAYNGWERASAMVRAVCNG